MLNRKTLYVTGILTLLVCAFIVFNRPKTTAAIKPVKLRFPRTSAMYGHEDLKVPFVTERPRYKNYVNTVTSVDLTYIPQLFPHYYKAILKGYAMKPGNPEKFTMEITDQGGFPEFTVFDLPWNF